MYFENTVDIVLVRGPHGAVIGRIAQPLAQAKTGAGVRMRRAIGQPGTKRHESTHDGVLHQHDLLAGLGMHGAGSAQQRHRPVLAHAIETIENNQVDAGLEVDHRHATDAQVEEQRHFGRRYLHRRRQAIDGAAFKTGRLRHAQARATARNGWWRASFCHSISMNKDILGPIFCSNTAVDCNILRKRIFASFFFWTGLTGLTRWERPTFHNADFQHFSNRRIFPANQ